MKAKNVFFLSVGAVVLAVVLSIAGVFYFRLKNTSESNQIIVEQEVEQKADNTEITEPDISKIPFEALDIAWLSKAERLSEVEIDKILNKLYFNYDRILSIHSQMLGVCKEKEDGDGCYYLNSDVKIKLSLAGHIRQNNDPVYIMEAPDFCAEMGFSIGNYLAFYDNTTNQLIRIVTGDDEYFDSDPQYGDNWSSCETGDLKSETFSLFAKTIRTSFAELKPPEKISLPVQDGGSYLALVGSRYSGFARWRNIGEYGDFGLIGDSKDDAVFTKQKTIFSDSKVGDVQFNGECYFFVNNVGSVFVYDLRPYFITPITPAEAEKEFFSNGYKLDVAWLNGVKDEDYFINGIAFGGCGNSFTGCAGIVKDTKSFVDDNLVEVAKTKIGDSIYELKNRFGSQIYWDLYLASGEVVKGVYNLKGLPNQQQLSEINALESYNKFINDRPILFWKDFAGNWRRLQKTKYQPQAECGKPVIYLYPEKEMDVKVEVKPNGGFTKTEPEYNNGWVVRATSQSELFNYADQKNYPYLFWEGHAYGFSIDSTRGFVMAKDNVGTEMTRILGKLGLNEKETKDFLEFWQPKLEVKPYVFITFVPQSEFDKAAPLLVNPKPDTIVRVFMDYTPLNAPIDVDPLRVKTPERKGFTVVEWGGRLR